MCVVVFESYILSKGVLIEFAGGEAFSLMNLSIGDWGAVFPYKFAH